MAEIGDVIEDHLIKIGLLQADSLDEHQKNLIAEKRLEHSRAAGTVAVDDDDDSFPVDAQLCPKCNTKAVVQLDGCMTCLSCGDSKCG